MKSREELIEELKALSNRFNDRCINIDGGESEELIADLILTEQAELRRECDELRKIARASNEIAEKQMYELSTLKSTHAKEIDLRQEEIRKLNQQLGECWVREKAHAKVLGEIKKPLHDFMCTGATYDNRGSWANARGAIEKALSIIDKQKEAE